MEYWDACDREGNPLGYEILRGEAMEEGVYHRVVEILLRHVDGDILLMQRSLDKIGFPGIFEATASGSLLTGEQPLHGAIRELREETGIRCEALQEVFVIADDMHTIWHGYTGVTDAAKYSVILQEEETMSYRWMKPEQFLRFTQSDQFVAPQRMRWAPYYQEILITHNE